ncbi:MAG: MBL fold metallo-hydrolase [Alphaproteobacteria bacterium]|jgi:glyoxylase-like metal-dependent hydrolase (beta-lactamase superfamily II)|nr:MBL fold metallo-hydrolase [Alphaproteobacteria bacterium]MBN9567948.1 MBL fold metallo-hydrolase [Alphaproteobacteria bacterium]OJU57005.1 MAG: MBL fold metallo-hydrolase [Alphaproteobacteria bacterium 62-8]
MAIPFIRTLDAPYEETVALSPRVSRLLARNPGPFTFKGSGVYVVGDRDIAVIDPGPDLPEHLDALRRAIAGKRVSHILVTHTHSDHSPAARPLKEWTGAPTYAFGPHGSGKVEDGGVRMEEGGDMDFVPDVRVKDGDIVRGDGFTFECVYTPGHTSNHMCFALKEEKALFTGDHIMGWSTTVVTPPDGDMAQYMASVKKLIARDDEILYPTHGAPVTDPKPFLKAYLEHRVDRENQILACLRDGVNTIPAMVARMYADVDKRLHPAASRSVLAHLIQLVNEGRATKTGEEYSLSVMARKSGPSS